MNYLRSTLAWSAYRCKRVRIEWPRRNNRADKVLVWGNWEGRECGQSTGKEASLNFRAADLDAMCLRSPRAFKPPVSVSLSPSLSLSLFLVSLSFISSPHVRSSLRHSFVGRFYSHRFFFLHIRIKISFQRIIGFTLLSTLLLSFSLSLYLFLSVVSILNSINL